jgi:hypothetical protein
MVSIRLAHKKENKYTVEFRILNADVYLFGTGHIWLEHVADLN